MTSMTMMQNARCDLLVDALRAEFGSIFTQRIIECEAADLMWDSRVRERYLGQHFEPLVDEKGGAAEVSRVAVLSAFDGRWHACICLVDGDGCADDLLWKRSFDSLLDAQIAYDQAR